TLCARRHFARNAGKSVKQVGTANDAHYLLTTYDGQTLDLMPLHHVHDRFKRSILAHNDRVARHDILNFAAVGVCVFIRESTRSNQKFKPSWSSTFRSSFSASKEIAFGDDAYKMTVFVHHWQSTDPLLEHDLRGLHNCGVKLDQDNGRR